jgi:hypothetical protein
MTPESVYWDGKENLKFGIRTKILISNLKSPVWPTRPKPAHPPGNGFKSGSIQPVRASHDIKRSRL